MKTTTKKQVAIAKQGTNWIIVGWKHGSGQHRLFSSEFRALEVAQCLWPKREVVYGK